MADRRTTQTPRRLVVAGVGLMSPLGFGAWSTFRSLLEGCSIADRAPRIEPGTDPVALVQGVGHVAVARQARDDPAAELAERAAREACEHAGVEPEGIATRFGTSKGAVGALSAGFRDRGRAARCAAAAALGPQGYLSHRFALRTGARVTGHHVAACASSLVALDAAAKELRTPSRPPARGADPQRDHRLVVTAEAALLPVFIHSYKRLGVLAEPTPTGYRQAPLDASRKGFMLAELAAAVVLRALPPGDAPAPGAVELVDTALAGEAYDMVRPSPGMEALRHVAERLIVGRRVDLLHPHAPGTADHDPAELRAPGRRAQRPARDDPRAAAGRPLRRQGRFGPRARRRGARVARDRLPQRPRSSPPADAVVERSTHPFAAAAAARRPAAAGGLLSRRLRRRLRWADGGGADPASALTAAPGRRASCEIVMITPGWRGTGMASAPSIQSISW